MKLYFYFLEEQRDKNPHIRVEECDVKESIKTYKLLGEVQGVYRSTVLKSEIGLCFGCASGQEAILEEPDFEYAKKLFAGYLNNQIGKNQKEIERLKENLLAVESMDGEQ